MFRIILRVAHSSSSTILQREALMILRNLAFSSTHKARIVAEGRSLSYVFHKFLYQSVF